MVTRFDVYLAGLDAVPTKDAKNTRPCVVISPNEMNAHLANVIIAPLSSYLVKYPTRVTIKFLNSDRMVVLDQIRTVDVGRLVKKIGVVELPAQAEIISALAEMFAN